MPAHAPDWVTDEAERELYRDLSRTYENYVGGPVPIASEKEKDKWEDKKRSFLNILTMIQTRLDPFSCGQCDDRCENTSQEVGGVYWKCPTCGWQPVTAVEIESL